jgi:hypothetical protein
VKNIVFALLIQKIRMENYYYSCGITIDDIKNILEIFALIGALLGTVLAFIVYKDYKYIPIILLDIKHHWINEETGQVLLKICVENKSKVRVEKDKFILHILEYPADTKRLSEWVPKSRNEEDNKRPEELPPDIDMPPIMDFMISSKFIYPCEVSTQDYLTVCPKGKLLHILLQFKSKSIFSDESWAITRIIINA